MHDTSNLIQFPGTTPERGRAANTDTGSPSLVAGRSHESAPVNDAIADYMDGLGDWGSQAIAMFQNEQRRADACSRTCAPTTVGAQLAGGPSSHDHPPLSSAHHSRSRPDQAEMAANRAALIRDMENRNNMAMVMIVMAAFFGAGLLGWALTEGIADLAHFNFHHYCGAC